MEDGCKERAKTWSKSIFTVDTTKPTRQAYITVVISPEVPKPIPHPMHNTISNQYPTSHLRLPIVDVRVKDIGKSRQAFKVEVGRVCFSWSKIVFFLFQAKFTFNWNSSSTNFPSSWISAVAWFLFNLSHGSSCGISPIKDHFGAAEMISFYSTFSPFLPKHKRGDY